MLLAALSLMWVYATPLSSAHVHVQRDGAPVRKYPYPALVFDCEIFTLNGSLFHSVLLAKSLHKKDFTG